MSEAHLLAEVAQRAVLFDADERVLVLQYDADHGWWAFPGGRLDEDEDPHAGLVREVREETGLTVEVVQPVFTSAFEYDEAEKFGVAYLCELDREADPTVELSDEHRAHQWIRPAELAELNTASSCLEAVLANARRVQEAMA